MASQPPQLIKPIPPQIASEGGNFGPLNLNEFFQNALHFSATLSSGATLPKNLICTNAGELSGDIAEGTQGVYEILVTAANDAGLAQQTTFAFTVLTRLAAGTSAAMDMVSIPDETYLRNIKAQLWDALNHDAPPPQVPDVANLFALPVRISDVMYLMERWSPLYIWNAHNFTSGDQLVPLTLEGCSPHYQIYDAGNCLIAAPKDLFSSQRTLEDALQTARITAMEVYKRGWGVELGGQIRMQKAAWIELQVLGQQYGKTPEIVNYTPTREDEIAYLGRSESLGIRPK